MKNSRTKFGGVITEILVKIKNLTLGLSRVRVHESPRGFVAAQKFKKQKKIRTTL